MSTLEAKKLRSVIKKLLMSLSCIALANELKSTQLLKFGLLTKKSMKREPLSPIG